MRRAAKSTSRNGNASAAVSLQKNAMPSTTPAAMARSAEEQADGDRDQQQRRGVEDVRVPAGGDHRGAGEQQRDVITKRSAPFASAVSSRICTAATIMAMLIARRTRHETSKSGTKCRTLTTSSVGSGRQNAERLREHELQLRAEGHRGAAERQHPVRLVPDVRDHQADHEDDPDRDRRPRWRTASGVVGSSMRSAV